jgi:transposase
MKTRRAYDRRAAPEDFKKMAVDLALAKGSVKTTAEGLGITPQILTRWRRERLGPPIAHSNGRPEESNEQLEILRLRKELKQAELERDILNTGLLKGR